MPDRSHKTIRRAVLTAALLSLSIPAHAYRHVEAVDGDTLSLPASGTSPGYRIRVEGLDSAELRGKCQYEKDLAQKAKARTAQLVAGGVTFVTDLDLDRYGRLLAKVYTRDGQNIADVLIKENLARPYDGKTARQPWCPGAPAEAR